MTRTFLHRKHNLKSYSLLSSAKLTVCHVNIQSKVVLLVSASASDRVGLILAVVIFLTVNALLDIWFCTCKTQRSHGGMNSRSYEVRVRTWELFDGFYEALSSVSKLDLVLVLFYLKGVPVLLFLFSGKQDGILFYFINS